MQCITDAVEDLQALYCNTCSGILSVKPVAIDIKSGLSICGRCITKSTQHIRNIPVEILAKQFTFPCKFAAEGCIERLTLEEAENHERSCTYHVFKCHCPWTGNKYDYINHFECVHSELVINPGDEFYVEKGDSTFLLKFAGLYFQITCTFKENIIQMFVIGITKLSLDYKGVFQCEWIGNMNIDISVDSMNIMFCNETFANFIFKVELSDDFLAKVSDSIVCPNCSIHMTPPILRCPLGHLTCLQCTGSWLDYCKECDTECTFLCDSELQCIAFGTLFKCKWECGNKFNCSEIRKHEQFCKKRIYSCWHTLDCDWSGDLTELVQHDSSCVSNLFGVEYNCMFYVDTPTVVFENVLSRTVCHLIVFGCCFNIIYDKDAFSTLLYINHYDINGYGWFRFEAELTHTQNPDSPFNKRYDFTHTYGGIYKKCVPNEDLECFEGSFKITVTVILLGEIEKVLSTNLLFHNFRNYSRLTL